MSLFFNKYFTTVTVSGGSVNISPEKFRGILHHVIVRAPNTSAVFNFTITDDKLSAFGVFQRESLTEELDEFIQMPLDGNYTLHIDSATVDGSYRIYLAIREI